MKRYFCLVAAGLMMLGQVAGVARAATVSIFDTVDDDSVANVLPGATFTLGMEGTGFTTTADGGAFEVTWDPDVITYVSISIADPPWDTVSVEDTNAATSGRIDLVFLGDSATPPAGPDFDIGVLTFIAADVVGDSTTVAAADVFGGWRAPGDVPIAVTYNDATVNVVPIPAAVWLFGSALLGLAGIARRRKAA